MACLLTFNCYGTHLRGDERGSVDRERKGRGGPIEPSASLVSYGERAMTHAEALLNSSESLMVLDAIRQTCAFRRWTLLAAHVRSTHVHLVVDGIGDESSAIRDFKAAVQAEGAELSSRRSSPALGAGRERKTARRFQRCAHSRSLCRRSPRSADGGVYRAGLVAPDCLCATYAPEIAPCVRLAIGATSAPLEIAHDVE